MSDRDARGVTSILPARWKSSIKQFEVVVGGGIALNHLSRAPQPLLPHVPSIVLRSENSVSTRHISTIFQ